MTRLKWTGASNYRKIETSYYNSNINGAALLYYKDINNTNRQNADNRKDNNHNNNHDDGNNAMSEILNCADVEVIPIFRRRR